MTTPIPAFLGASFPLPLDLPFTRRAALESGLQDKQLGRLAREGYLRRPIKGVYVAAQLTDTLDLRAEILRLILPEGVFITDRTAGWLHGAEMILAPNDHLAVPVASVFRPRDADRLRNGLTRSGERTLAPRDLMEVRGLKVTTPLRTALDLGRMLPRVQALSAIDSLLRLGSFTHEELLADVERFARQRGVVQLRWLAPLGDGRAQSPGETALRLHWRDAGLPRPELQIPILEAGHVIFWLDIGLEEMLFAAEYDGKEWHTAEEDSLRQTPT